tara:strand:+ start:4120 stop:5808 length:1689 start_codon:yes stop_codon:yes gene_type:complete
MNSIVKINSNEGGQFNAQNNRVSFDIPSDKYYDLSSAYLNLVMSCDPTSDNTPTIGKGVYIPIVKFTDTGGNGETLNFENSAIVRSVKLDCELKGNIEEIQRADILTQNINHYSKSNDMEISQYYEKLIQPFNVSRTKSSLFTELHKEGTVPSRNLSRQPVRIKLSDMMNFCKTTQYNTGKYGKTRLELELNLDRIAPIEQYLPNTVGSFDWTMPNDGLLGATNEQGRFMNAGLVPGFGNAVSKNLTTFYVASDIAMGQATGIVPRIFNRLEDSVYYVGQKLSLSATYINNGGAARGGNIVGQIRRIVNIEYNRGNIGAGQGAGSAEGVNRGGVLAVTLDSPIDGDGVMTGTDLYHSIKVRGVDCTFDNGLVADYAELVVEEIAQANVQPEPDTIQYTTYKTEEIDTGGVESFFHTFQMEPEAITMYITQPTVGANRTIMSRQNDVDSYRIRINNKDASARKIFLRDSGGSVRSEGDDPLHIVKLQNALINSGRSLMNFTEKMNNINTNNGFSTNTFDVDTMLIGQVLPITSQPKQVQVNIQCRSTATINNICLFREVIMEL